MNVFHSCDALDIVTHVEKKRSIVILKRHPDHSDLNKFADLYRQFLTQLSHTQDHMLLFNIDELNLSMSLDTITKINKLATMFVTNKPLAEQKLKKCAVAFNSSTSGGIINIVNDLIRVNEGLVDTKCFNTLDGAKTFLR